MVLNVVHNGLLEVGVPLIERGIFLDHLLLQELKLSVTLLHAISERVSLSQSKGRLHNLSIENCPKFKGRLAQVEQILVKLLSDDIDVDKVLQIDLRLDLVKVTQLVFSRQEWNAGFKA